VRAEARIPKNVAETANRPFLTGPLDVDPLHGQQLICHGYTLLLSNPDGTVTADSRQGLFDHDTRLLSTWTVLIDGVAPRVDSSGLVRPNHWTARLTVPWSSGDAKGPQLPQDGIELALDRRLGCGMIEQWCISNHSAVHTMSTVTICVEADFRDIAEVAGIAEPRGTIARTWDDRAGTLTIDWQASRGERTVHRAVRIRACRADSSPRGDEHALTFDVPMAAHGSWHAELHYEIFVDGRWRGPMEGRPLVESRERVAASWERDRAHVASDPPAFGVAIERAADDLSALRIWEHETAPNAWVPNAGLPTYTGLFGRDVLTAGWQAALLGPDMLRGALARLADTQATADSAWHDAEPGKMIHELRRGPLSELEIIPQRGYYGTQTSSSFFVVTLSELWHWTGDSGLLRTYRDAALRTFDWADRYGDCDGDGLLEYQKRSPRGLKNQGWKDSDEAIRYPDGELVDNPIATIEEQAFHWLALQRMAAMLLALGDDDRAADFVERARRIRAVWHRAFWMEEESFYAMALDPSKRQVRSVGSNPGHALAAGLVPPERARQVADRLMARDLFSGWGIRTLSSDHPSYNPLAYHLGTVWPVENATIALGFKRYGLDQHCERLITGIFEAAARFRHSRLPEALGGHSREDAPIPTVYPESNCPQAWSASALIQMAQTMLGIYPFAPAHVLALVRPMLPPWLTTVVVRNLQIGEARVSIQFERSADGVTHHTVLEKAGRLHILDVPPPQQARDQQSWRDVISTWALAHAPGRTAAALRKALGDDA
jgi:glycogen debranching enzyme